MEDFYHILSRYFSNQPSELETKKIEQFKKENKKEFNLLKALWDGDKIEVLEFDTDTAWDKVEKRYQSKQKDRKVFRLKRIIQIAVSTAAVLLLGFFLFPRFEDNQLASEVQMQTISNQSTESQQFLLADGSIVWLNKGAELSYPSEFSNQTRTVSLNGEAFFEVTKNPNKSFIVETENAQIEVLGTSFNINSTSKKTEVTVRTGKVKLSNSNNLSAIITPDHIGTLSDDNIVVDKNQDKNYLSWKTGIFSFERQALSNVVTDLNTYYNKPIIIDSETAANCEFTAKFTNLPLSAVIAILQRTCELEIVDTEIAYHIK